LGSPPAHCFGAETKELKLQTSPEVPHGKTLSIGEELQMHYHEAGEGPPVIFVHGSGPGGSGWSNFQGNFEELADEGFRCLVPDLIGYGHSSKPADAEYSLQFLTDGLLAFADALELKAFHLIGNSLGGAICIRIAIDQPERVKRMVLMAPGGLEAREVYMGMKGIRSMLRAIFDPEGLNLSSMRKVFSKQLFEPAIISENLLQQRMSIAETQPQAVFSTSRVPNQSDELHRINCPVLGFWGNDDQFCPVSGAQTLAEKIGDIRMVRFSRCGHWVMVEKQKIFNRMTSDFLKEK
jgi:4,5:9,10-diseco-3-hydroxy-5,9,17-trioxoandrosta-1(10),2-diene-4-oate hydrolase